MAKKLAKHGQYDEYWVIVTEQNLVLVDYEWLIVNG